MYTAYDGLADVATLTSGRVHALDLTIDSQARATCTRNSARHMRMLTAHAHAQARAQAHARHMRTAHVARVHMLGRTRTCAAACLR